MSSICIIPARGGSKGVPGKNLRAVGSRSLVNRAVAAARATEAFDVIVVSTDSSNIADEARRCGAVVVDRPANLATDEATSEAAILDALSAVERNRPNKFDVVAFLQCTSPFIDSQALSTALARVAAREVDVVFSVVVAHAFLWAETSDGSMAGVNHESSVRLRRQDRAPEYLETGAFYVMERDGFVDTGHRFFGRLGVAETDQRRAIEIDTPDDLEIAERLAPMLEADIRDGIDWSDVTAFVMDFDGVHTDNAAYVSEAGVESVRVNRSDGLGIAQLRQIGIKMLVLSTETNPVVERRAAKLGVDCISGCEDKLPALRRWAQQAGVAPANIAYIGNDLNDRDCLEWVGVPVVVADAHRDLFFGANLVTNKTGGNGAIREIADRLWTAHRTTTSTEDLK